MRNVSHHHNVSQIPAEVSVCTFTNVALWLLHQLSYNQHSCCCSVSTKFILSYRCPCDHNGCWVLNLLKPETCRFSKGTPKECKQPSIIYQIQQPICAARELPSPSIECFHPSWAWCLRRLQPACTIIQRMLHRCQLQGEHTCQIGAHILIVPLGPRLVFSTSCSPLAALMFIWSAADLLRASALGLSTRIAISNVVWYLPHWETEQFWRSGRADFFPLLKTQYVWTSQSC